ncbi:MAG: BamA/TamA family outer membrane protein [Gemmatimonadetes bacterium]|nr:BamA/TamA family outer membrane protein [Gemmatimonadota bacterium]
MRTVASPHDGALRRDSVDFGAYGAGVRSRRLRLRLLFVCGVLLSAAPAPAFSQALRDTVEVLSVDVRGAQRVPVAIVRSVIATQATGCISAALQPLCWLGMSLDRHYLDARVLTADLLRLRLFYHQRGFREARVDLDTTHVSGGIRILFRIHEGEPVIVTSVEIQGASEIGGGVTGNLPLRAGQPLSMIEFEATRDTLITRLANRGYAAADVLANYEVPASDSRRATVDYQLMTGPLTRFGEVTITGTDRVSPSVVQRMLTFREGDLYSRQALLRSQRNLFGLAVFRHAEIITADPTQGDTVLPVRVQVNEGDLHRIRLGLGLSTADFLNAEGRWVSRNFLGRARRLEVRSRVSNIVAEPLRTLPGFEGCSGIYCDEAGSVAIDFSQPWFFDLQNTFGAGLFIERFTLPGVYVRTSRGGYLSFGRTIGRGAVASIGFRPELTKLESDGDLIFCVNFTVCEEREIDIMRSAHWLAPLAVSLGVDRSNNVFSPTAGYILRLDGEYAARGTGSEFDYVRVIADASQYHDPFRGVVIATRLRPGWARAIGAPGSGLGLHPQKRFFGGGPNSVRGFAQYRLGPKLLAIDDGRVLADTAGHRPGCTPHAINDGTCDVSRLAARAPGEFELRPVGGAVLLEGNVEARFPIWPDRLNGAAFLDVGQVWRSVDELDLRTLAWTPGVGIRYMSPIGPIRVDVGYNPAGAERLDVVTTEVCHRTAADVCADIEPGVTYPLDELGNRRNLRTLPSVMWQPERFQFHFSIGQAF